MRNNKHLTIMTVLLGLIIVGGPHSALANWWIENPNPHMSSSKEGHIFLVVNQDQFEGQWKQFKGELKKQWGNFTDDDLLQIEGKMEKLEGKIQERYGDRKEELKEWMDEWFDQHALEAQSPNTSNLEND